MQLMMHPQQSMTRLKASPIQLSSCSILFSWSVRRERLSGLGSVSLSASQRQLRLQDYLLEKRKIHVRYVLWYVIMHVRIVLLRITWLPRARLCTWTKKHENTKAQRLLRKTNPIQFYHSQELSLNIAPQRCTPLHCKIKTRYANKKKKQSHKSYLKLSYRRTPLGRRDFVRRRIHDKVRCPAGRVWQICNDGCPMLLGATTTWSQKRPPATMMWNFPEQGENCQIVVNG